jgi:hypothetical protein
MRFTPTIIFTKYDHLNHDLYSRINEEEEESGEDMSSTEIEMPIISRSTEFISDYMNEILFYLPKAKFFIFDPNSKGHGYRFKYGSLYEDNKLIFRKYKED